MHTPKNREVSFSDIMATASRLSTLYGLETLHEHSSRYFRIIKKVFGISVICDVFTASSMSNF